MLPTEKASSVFKKNDRLFYDPEQIIPHPKCSGNNQHLYGLSDETPKNGDLVYYKHPLHDEGMITTIVNWNYSDYEPYGVQHTEGFGVKEGYKKIIWTTDETLVIKNNCNCFATTYEGCSECLELLPRPSNEFLKKFCELGGVDKVLVEYEVDTIKSACTCEDSESTSNCVFSYYDGTDECCRKRFPNGEYWDKTYKLKVAPDNTITIYPI